jgi:hypothetical protein
MSVGVGPITDLQLNDPVFSSILWKLTPASLAVRLSQGQFKTWNYIQLLSRKLVDVAMGRCPRLILCLPPRHGKSELVSKWFSIWYMENFPANRIILASYEADFAAKWGGKARDVIQENQELLSIRFKSKNPAQHYWETTEGGAMMTGKGANIFLIDDCIKNSEEANSLTMREKLWEWYTSTARTRLEPNGAMVVVCTRWNSDDLVGRLINPEFSSEKGTREKWEVFCFPACAEPESERHYSQFGVTVNNLRLDSMTSVQTKQPVKSIRQVLADENDPEWRDILGRKRGEALCPDRYDENDLARIRSVSLRDWYSLFQQRPGDEADDGNVYHQFDERKHCKLLDRNDTMQLFVSLDFNVDPMCCVVGQYQKGNGLRQMERCEVLEEIILPNSNTPNMMEKLLIELKKYQYGYTLEVEIYGDAAGTQRSSQSQKSNWQIVAEYFMLDLTIHPRFVRRKANPMIVDRVNAVNTMLKSADGSMRLFVDDTKCPELVKDFKKVRWQQDASGNSTGLLDKSDKRRTHISDALGYQVEYNFSLKVRGGGRRGVLQ